jgi:hypothetical protein
MSNYVNPNVGLEPQTVEYTYGPEATLSIKVDCAMGLGGQLWPAAQLFGDLLSSTRQYDNTNSSSRSSGSKHASDCINHCDTLESYKYKFLQKIFTKRKRVLELGSGVGLGGILVYKYFADVIQEVVISDLIQYKNIIEENIAQNCLPRPNDIQHENVDRILNGSDDDVVEEKEEEEEKEQKNGSGSIRFEVVDWLDSETPGGVRPGTLPGGQLGLLPGETHHQADQDTINSFNTISQVPAGESEVSGMGMTGSQTTTLQGSYDVILALECVYRRDLYIPLINTLNKYSHGDEAEEEEEEGGGGGGEGDELPCRQAAKAKKNSTLVILGLTRLFAQTSFFTLLKQNGWRYHMVPTSSHFYSEEHKQASNAKDTALLLLYK